MSFDLRIEEDDLVISDETGDISLVTAADKLTQDILKILITEAGNNFAHVWYGSTILKFVGSTLPDSVLDTAIKEAILNALEELRSLQLEQEQTQLVLANEKLAQVLDIKVLRSLDDARLLNVFIKYRSGSREVVEETFSIII